MKIFYVRLILLFSFIPLLTYAGDTNLQSSQSPMKKVLVVHSYNQQYEWVSTISRGIKRVFEPEKGISLETIFMDTRNVISEEEMAIAGQRARDIITQWDPDLVITVDDNAQEYVGKYYAGKKRPLIVFCGVSRPIEEYGYAAGNVTGIREISTLKKAVDFLDQNITPVKNISIISDDSTLSEYLISIARDEMESMGKKVILSQRANSFNKWKTAVSECQKNGSGAIFVILYDDVRADDGTVLPSEKVIRWSAENSRIPVFGLGADMVDKFGS
jgi:ABC-type uncharacterized transport system substrate-binding protein